MLNLKQKLIVTAVGGLFVAQAAALTKVFHDAFDVQNKAQALFNVLDKHVDNLDAEDLQNMHKHGLLK